MGEVGGGGGGSTWWACSVARSGGHAARGSSGMPSKEKESTRGEELREESERPRLGLGSTRLPLRIGSGRGCSAGGGGAKVRRSWVGALRVGEGARVVCESTEGGGLKEGVQRRGAEAGGGRRRGGGGGGGRGGGSVGGGGMAPRPTHATRAAASSRSDATWQRSRAREYRRRYAGGSGHSSPELGRGRLSGLAPARHARHRLAAELRRLPPLPSPPPHPTLPPPARVANSRQLFRSPLCVPIRRESETSRSPAAPLQRAPAEARGNAPSG